MTEKIGIVYWCEGAGHAARNLSIASEMESRGAEVLMAGGGPGKKFVELNGFEDPVPEPVTTIENKTDSEVSKTRFLAKVLFEEVPSYFKRFRDIYRWIGEEQPNKIVTDDFLAVIASLIKGVEFYRIEHMTPEIVPLYVELPLRVYDWLTLKFGENIFITSIWEIEDEREGIEEVGPLAQQGHKEVEPFDVLLIPGTMSEGFEDIREKLEDRGLHVRMVGDESWEMAPAMTPYTEAASCVICTGFSSIADTVVPGTPCVVFPFFSIQESIAQEIEERDLKGFECVNTKEEAVNSAEKFCKDSSETPDATNGAEAVVDRVLES
jgi:hypothetical protein